MSHKDRSRRLARRTRKREEQEAHEKAAVELRLNPPPINFSRMFQTFSTMSFRSHVKGGTRLFQHYMLGPTVDAKTPEELVSETDNLCIDAVLGEPEN